MDPALSSLLRYFAALERYDLDAAAACFAEDAVYHHPPYRFPGHEEDATQWHRAVGRENIKRLWEFRGPQDSVHHVTGFARNGNLCFNEGWSAHGGNTEAVSYVSVFRVSDDGLIAEYQTYTHFPRRPLLGAETPITLAER
jgi:ketosteroid isomerase-like protein